MWRVHYQIHKAVSELSKHVIKLSPVQLELHVVSSLVCISVDGASLYRLHSNIEFDAMLFGINFYLVKII